MVPLLQPEDLLKELTNLQEKSKDFLKGSVAQELEEIVSSIRRISMFFCLCWKIIRYTGTTRNGH